MGRHARDAATPMTAPAVVHLMIRSTVIMWHRRQVRTQWSEGMGFLVQTPFGHIVIMT
jgi:hypothetical protein